MSQILNKKKKPKGVSLILKVIKVSQLQEPRRRKSQIHHIRDSQKFLLTRLSTQTRAQYLRRRMLRCR